MQADGGSMTPALTLRHTAPAGALLFFGGFFALAARDAAASAGVYGLIALGAALLVSGVLAVTAVVAGLEAWSGRAWAAGFRRLPPAESGARGWARRALRYATFLWLCNGAAFIVAALR